MDLSLLHFFNRQLAHPALDVLMIIASTGGLAMLPALGLTLWVRDERKLGSAILIALLVGLLVTFVFHFLALRPRPSDVRLLLPTPIFPSFPSGHATAAFATALVLTLYAREWRMTVLALTVASVIALSRVYLGHHYPSDIVAGALLGSAIGAASYGLIVQGGDARQQLRWLLFPQLAIAALMTMMAYLDLLPFHLLRWPLADKTLHFLFFGSLGFWLNFWLNGRTWQVLRQNIPVALALPLSLSTLEESLQALSPLRTADITDLLANGLGLFFFWWLSRRVLRRTAQTGASSADQ